MISDDVPEMIVMLVGLLEGGISDRTNHALDS